MRDIAITLIVFGSLPFILRRPFFGVMMWTWLGLMNPHRLAWGFSLNFPFALIVFVTTVVGYAISREPKKLPMSREVVLLIVFILWMFLTTNMAWYPNAAWIQWDKVWRIQLGIALTLMLTTNRYRIQLLAWTIAVSLGFYGFKGGIWTVMTGGANRVYGPLGTFIGGNNELGLALVMTVPIIWYLALTAKRIWLRNCLYAGVGFTTIAIIGTHSRGALVGLSAMGMLFLMKSRRKFLPILGVVALVLALPAIVPEEWFARMHTIQTYEEDQSAMDRINAWKTAFRIAQESVTGGGFEVLISMRGVVDAHSIYFEILGEQGFIGLGLFLSISLLAWMKAARIKRVAKPHPDLTWARDLALMLQTSLGGYAVCGAFLGLAYFDLFYLMIALIVVLNNTVNLELASLTEPKPVPVSFAGQVRLPRRDEPRAAQVNRQ